MWIIVMFGGCISSDHNRDVCNSGGCQADAADPEGDKWAEFLFLIDAAIIIIIIIIATIYNIIWGLLRG